jgi:prepilin-type N-terminal cleavage/methylation domain-containing protein
MGISLRHDADEATSMHITMYTFFSKITSYMRKSNVISIDLRAFTLVELLVVLGLFSSIMTMALGALFSSQAVNVRLQSTQAVLDNVNLSMAVMTRDIRYGTAFYCGGDVSTSSPVLLTTQLLRRSCNYQSNGSSTLFFKPAGAAGDSDRVVYSSSVLTKTYQITSNDILVKSLVFYVKGASDTTASTTINYGGAFDFEQPLITVTLSGTTDPPKKSFVSVTTTGVGRSNVTTKENIHGTKFTIQTSISPRELDN